MLDFGLNENWLGLHAGNEYRDWEIKELLLYSEIWFEKLLFLWVLSLFQFVVLDWWDKDYGTWFGLWHIDYTILYVVTWEIVKVSVIVLFWFTNVVPM